MLIARLMLATLIVLAAAFPAASAEAAAGAAPRAGSSSSPASGIAPRLTLREALGLALNNHPELAVFTAEIRAREAAALQSGLWPNPGLVVEVENFAGEGDQEGFDGAETTIGLSQQLELAGKPTRRRRVARLETHLAGWDYQSRKQDVLAATARAFVQVLAARQRLDQSRALEELAAKSLAAVRDRVEAGKVPPVEEIRARVELAAARTEVDKSGRELAAARSRLFALWGERPPEGGRPATGTLAAEAALPPLTVLSERLENNPDLARWETEIGRSRAAFDLARAEAIPDVTLGLGVRHQQETDSQALVAGIEVPLPVFDRNQGGVARARAQLEKARRERHARRIRLQAELAAAWQELAAAHSEATTLSGEILPGAQEAFEAMEFGYREGKFDFLQMLDAQRTLFQVRGQYLRALLTYHLASIEVARLTGAPLHGLLGPEPTTLSESR